MNRSIRRLALPLALALALAAPLAAQPTPVGPEFPLDDSPPAAAGVTADVAAAPGGSFLGVWSVPEGAILARAFSPSEAPLGPEAQLRPAVSKDEPRYGKFPRAVALAGGGYVAAWENQPSSDAPSAPSGNALAPGTSTTLSFRLLDALGQPAGPEVVVADDIQPRDWAVAADPAGGFLLAWGVPGVETAGRRFDAQGRPAGAALSFPIAPPSDAVFLPDGSFVLASMADLTAGPLPRILGVLQVFAADGSPRSDAIVFGDFLATHVGPRLSAERTGGFLVAWTTSTNEDRLSFWAQRFSSTGTPLGAEIHIDPDASFQGYGYGDVSARPDGGFLAVFQAPSLQIQARAYAADGAPQGGAFPLATRAGLYHELPAAAATPRGWVVSWTEGIGASAPYARQLQGEPLPLCSGLCLGGDRFEVRVTWRVSPTGAEGAGIPIPLTGDTGAFWFFAPSNYELVVKVLDGRGINGHFWVFYGSLTDVAFDLTVTDTLTGEQRTYHNPAGTMASHADTLAF